MGFAVVEHEHGRHYVRHIEHIDLGILRLLHRQRHHLPELLRAFYIIRYALRHLLHLREEALHLFREGFRLSCYARHCLGERGLLRNGVEHMFGREELVVPDVAGVHRHAQRLLHVSAVSKFSHRQSLIRVCIQASTGSRGCAPSSWPCALSTSQHRSCTRRRRHSHAHAHRA